MVIALAHGIQRRHAGHALRCAAERVRSAQRGQHPSLLRSEGLGQRRAGRSVRGVPGAHGRCRDALRHRTSAAPAPRSEALHTLRGATLDLSYGGSSPDAEPPPHDVRARGLVRHAVRLARTTQTDPGTPAARLEQRGVRQPLRAYTVAHRAAAREPADGVRSSDDCRHAPHCPHHCWYSLACDDR